MVFCGSARVHHADEHGGRNGDLDGRNVEGEAQKQSDRNERSKRAEHVDLFVLMFFFGLGGVFKTALLEVAVGDADTRHQDDEAAADHEGHVGVPAHELHHLHAGELAMNGLWETPGLK